MSDRMKREEFHDRVVGLDRQQLIKVLWTLYWRGSAAVRQRVEGELHTIEHGTPPRPAKPPVDPAAVREDVEEFAMLARAGAYLAGDRRVSPKERTRWRFTFRRLVADTQKALREPEAADAIIAAELLVELAQEMKGTDYVRSDDPVEAAGFVVSEHVALLWGTVLEREGFDGFARRAAPQLIRWESEYGWTRTGWGKVPEKETSLAQVLVGMLTVPDAWVGFADAYLDALDDAPRTRGGARRPWESAGRVREERAANLAEWHLLLLDQLIDTDAEDRLERLTQHPALGGPELQYLQARLAHRHGDLEVARQLMERALGSLPGHRDFLLFAAEIGVELVGLSPSARRVVPGPRSSDSA